MTGTAGDIRVGGGGGEERPGPPPDGARWMTGADPTRMGKEGTKGTGKEGTKGTGKEGTKGAGKEGTKGAGKEGTKGTGQEGTTGAGQEGTKGTGKEGARGEGGQGSEDGTKGTGKEMGDTLSLVPDTVWKRLVSQLLVVKGHIRTGAEARVFRGRYLGMDVVVKERYPRSYRARELDDELRKHRLRAEARLLVEARGLGVNTPRVFDLDLTGCILILQYLPFPSLKEVLGTDGIPIPPPPGSPPGSGPDSPCMDSHDRALLIREAGRLTGVLHAHDIIHGDLTTSNILVERGGLWFIDFGLAEKTGEVENKGVDLHVFTEAFESTHSALLHLLDEFLAGYREGNPVRGNEVIARAGEIAKRGRYS